MARTLKNAAHKARGQRALKYEIEVIPYFVGKLLAVILLIILFLVGEGPLQLACVLQECSLSCVHCMQVIYQKVLAMCASAGSGVPRYM